MAFRRVFFYTRCMGRNGNRPPVWSSTRVHKTKRLIWTKHGNSIWALFIATRQLALVYMVLYLISRAPTNTPSSSSSNLLSGGTKLLLHPLPIQDQRHVYMSTGWVSTDHREIAISTVWSSSHTEPSSSDSTLSQLASWKSERNVSSLSSLGKKQSIFHSNTLPYMLRRCGVRVRVWPTFWIKKVYVLEVYVLLLFF